MHLWSAQLNKNVPDCIDFKLNNFFGPSCFFRTERLMSLVYLYQVKKYNLAQPFHLSGYKLMEESTYRCRFRQMLFVDIVCLC